MTKSSTSLAVMQIAVPTAKSWLRGTRSMLVLVGLAGIVALALGWYSLGFAAIAPIFYLLPCAAMMAMCAKGMSRGDGQTGSKCGTARSSGLPMAGHGLHVLQAAGEPVRGSPAA